MSGYFGHSQVPGNDHGDPGVVDLKRIFPNSKTEDDEVAVLPNITGANNWTALTTSSTAQKIPLGTCLCMSCLREDPPAHDSDVLA